MANTTPALTDDQRQALHAADDRGPVAIFDAVTNRTFVLLSADLFERYRALLSEDEFPLSEAYRTMDEVARSEGWLDPEMDAYDQLDPRRAS